MGYYLETGAAKNKAEALRAQYEALEITQEEAEFFITEGTGAIVCVVDNGPFEAAAFCHNLDEYRHFTLPADPRPKTWLLIDDRELVERATGYNCVRT